MKELKTQNTVTPKIIEFWSDCIILTNIIDYPNTHICKCLYKKTNLYVCIFFCTLTPINFLWFPMMFIDIHCIILYCLNCRFNKLNNDSSFFSFSKTIFLFFFFWDSHWSTNMFVISIYIEMISYTKKKKTKCHIGKIYIEFNTAQICHKKCAIWYFYFLSYFYIFFFFSIFLS